MMVILQMAFVIGIYLAGMLIFEFLDWLWWQLRHNLRYNLRPYRVNLRPVPYHPPRPQHGGPPYWEELPNQEGGHDAH